MNVNGQLAIRERVRPEASVGPMSVTAGDEYPLHQSANWASHVVTSDRNFYDRNYFNLMPQSGELMCIFGMGQYPNLGVHDAFLTVAHADKHHIVRLSLIHI